MTPAEGAQQIPDDVLIMIKVAAVTRGQAIKDRSPRQVLATQRLDLMLRVAYHTKTTNREHLDMLMNAAVREHNARNLPSRLSLRGIRK